MSDHNQTHGHNDHDQVETSAVKPRPILMFLVILGVATAFVFVIVKVMEWGLAKMDEPNKGQTATQVQLPAEKSRKLPPSPQPLLQGAPGYGSTAQTDVPTMLPLEEMAKVRKDTNEKVNGYGWVDKQTGVAHIPIERAKAMIVEKGLPQLPNQAISDEVRKAEAARKQVLNADSSAGRMLKAQPQIQRPAQPPNQSQQGQQQTQVQGQQQKPK